MADFNDEISGIRVVGQIPLDAKSYSPNQNLLKILGDDNNLAYTYFEGMVVFCIEEKTRWEWREAVGAEQGLIDDNFTYPDGLVALGINYSLRSFNFFPLVYLPTPIAYLELRVVEKGVINSVANVLPTLEIGDTVQGRKDEFTTWTAIYNGGDPTDRDNYTSLTEIMFIGDPGNLPSVNPYQGPSAYQVALDNGFVGTVEEWLLSLEGADGNNGIDGIDGLSAYEIALANGFVGTVEEWLLTLKGEQGYDGLGMEFIGEWSSTNGYGWHQIVRDPTDNNNMYISNISNSNKIPSQNPVEWRFFLAAAVDGADASNNFQKDITLNYELVDADNNYVIQIFNDANPITITVPATGLREKFNCGFIRKGTGDVQFVGAIGVTLLNSVGFRIKEQHDPAYIERDKNTQNYALLGTTKA